MFAFHGDELFAQNLSITDSMAINNILQIFKEKIAGQLRLYNGIEDSGYPLNIIGNPYYLNDSLILGSVDYDGNRYHNVPLMYDMVKDAVVIKYFNTPFNIRLLNSKLTSFDLSGHHFVVIDSIMAIGNLKHGIYDQLYDGTYQLYVRRSALTQQVISNSKVVVRINRAVQYYIVKDQVAYAVNNMRSALRLVEDAGVIKSHLKKNKLKYRKAKEAVLKEIVSYHDNISR